jgi:hypothetical protein
MTQQEIQERNKQIALMMGAIDYKADKWYKLGGYKEHIYFPNWNYPNRFLEKDLKFHSDWNWLMEAVEFIEKQRYEVIFFNHYNWVEHGRCCIRDYKNSELIYISSDYKKEAVFIAVSDFAKLFSYNNINKNYERNLSNPRG